MTEKRYETMALTGNLTNKGTSETFRTTLDVPFVYEAEDIEMNNAAAPALKFPAKWQLPDGKYRFHSPESKWVFDFEYISGWVSIGG